MAKNDSKPENITQNLHRKAALARSSQDLRIRLYRGIAERALHNLRVGRQRLKVPKLVGLRRTGGPAFHATPELFFQQCGSTLFEMPEEKFTVGPGELCIMPTGMPHRETTLASRGRFLTLITMFWPDGISLHFGHSLANRRVVSDPYDRFLLPGNLFQQCLQEIASVRHNADGPDPYVDSLLLLSLTSILKALDSPHGKGDARLDLVSRCQLLLEQHLKNRHLSVSWLAGHLGCTPDHLSRAFQAKTGTNLVDTINRGRIQCAVQLMSRLEFNIAEIAWTCGYSTQSYFNRLFLRQMGLTPRQYRASITTAPPGAVGLQFPD